MTSDFSSTSPTSSATSTTASATTSTGSPNVNDLDPIALELRQALTRLPRTIPPRWLYDDRGSELFSEITRLPEYYQTEAERSILEANSTAIAEITEATTVVELGSGTSDKTRNMLDAFAAHGLIERFVPLDVSEQTLLDAADMLAERHPEIEVEPVVGDFTRHLSRLGQVGADGPRLVAFLGGTIGNFYVEERRAFLGALSDVLQPGDWVLLGIDQVKPIDRLIDAYDDSQGVTEAFIRNALTNINATYDGNLDVGNFGYVPFWDGRQRRIDMRLRADEPMSARIDGLDLDLELAPGEEIRVEISSKFRPADLVVELAQAGFGAESHVFSDDNDDFALVLARRG
nr:L-histidine N(alpha)-methyltransferase [Ilumatobacter coccineus]